MTKIVHTPEIEKKMESIGLDAVGEGLAASDAFGKSEITMWARVVAAAKITVDSHENRNAKVINAARAQAD